MPDNEGVAPKLLPVRLRLVDGPHPDHGRNAEHTPPLLPFQVVGLATFVPNTSAQRERMLTFRVIACYMEARSDEVLHQRRSERARVASLCGEAGVDVVRGLWGTIGQRQ